MVVEINVSVCWCHEGRGHVRQYFRQYVMCISHSSHGLHHVVVWFLGGNTDVSGKVSMLGGDSYYHMSRMYIQIEWEVVDFDEVRCYKLLPFTKIIVWYVRFISYRFTLP